MVTAAEIGWGKYRNYEGPFYRGKFGYTLPASPTEDEKVMAVITATEGGHFDAWNGYDTCGWTSGLIQWCEKAQYSVSDMLGAVAEEAGARGEPMLQTVDRMAVVSGVIFKRNAKGRWRFFFTDSRGEVDSLAEQLQLFYKHGDGTQGTWTDETRAYAKAWGAAISTVWENPVAQAVQTKFTAARLGGFMLSAAKQVFASAPDTDLARGLRAAYLSFAANNPTWANKSLATAVAQSAQLTAWSIDWVIAVLRELTFGPQVAIYPHRYDAIRPVLEALYGLSLPDFSAELKSWSAATGIPAGLTPKRLQEALGALGYDLGPKGADGVYGKKTREAVLTLEQLSGIVPVEHQDGMVDVYTWPALQEALNAKKLTFSV